MEDNGHLNKILLLVDSVNQVMCDMVFEYINELYILNIINNIVLIINTQNDTYELDLTILH